MTAYIIRATTRRHPGDEMPGLRYWNATTARWQDYQNATVYDTDNLTCPQGPRSSSTTTIVQPYPIDADGFPYRVDDLLGPVRMTHCCGAATSCDDTTFYCKSCYQPTSSAYELPARPTTPGENRMGDVSDHAPDSDPADPGRSLAPPSWDLFTARHTSTPFAAYASADPRRTQFGCCYFATDADREQYVAAARTTDLGQSVYRWDLDRSTGLWSACPPVEPDQEVPATTDVFAALAQRIVDGHPDSTATVGQLTITVQVRPDPDTDPAADNPDAYAYTGEAIAAFRRGEWGMRTVTVQIDTHGVQARAAQRGVEHGLATADGERDFLAGSLLPDLLAEAGINLHTAADAVDTLTGANLNGPASQPRAIPATLDDHPVVAWIPTFGTPDSAVAVGYRSEPEYDHVPYVVATVQQHPSESGQYRILDGLYEVEDLGEATLEAIALAEREATRPADGYDQRDGAQS